MLKKRIIFALLWDDGFFCQSRNFRLQRVGDYQWLTRHYRFDLVARAIDELVILDVTRGPRQSEPFLRTVGLLAESLQVPLSVGGGLDSLRDAAAAFAAGADKVVFNRAVLMDSQLIRDTSQNFGQQCVVASLDVRKTESGFCTYTKDGMEPAIPLAEFFLSRDSSSLGEIVLNSVDLDGTGNGLELEMVESVHPLCQHPIVLMGGIGKPDHIVTGLLHPRVDAVCTSNLLNFIGDGLSLARAACSDAAIDIPIRANWESLR